MPWTLTHNGTEQTLADWHLSGVTGTFQSQAVDEVSFHADGRAVDAPLLFTPFQSTITIRRNRVQDSGGLWSGGSVWFTGLPVNFPANSEHSPFPYNAPPAPGDPAWIVRDDYYSHTTIIGPEPGPAQFTIKTQVEVFLSNQYTLAMLDADTDALINSINPDSLPWGTVTPVWYPDLEYGDAFGGLGTHWAQYALQNFIPSPYQLTLGFDRVTVPFASAAGYAYAFNPFRLDPLQDGSPEGYCKWVGFFRLAGKFCLKTFTIDYTEKPIGNPTCTSGQGTCANSGSIIRPPPLVIGQNTYLTITPNCQCE